MKAEKAVGAQVSGSGSASSRGRRFMWHIKWHAAREREEEYAPVLIMQQLKRKCKTLVS